MNRKFALYVTKRVLVVVPQLLGVSIVTFFLIRLLPGDPARFLLGPHATESSVANLSRLMGLDRSVPEQYAIYLGDVLEGDLGRSWFTGQSVLEDLVQRAPATLELITYSLLLALVVGVAIGAWTATRQGRGRVAMATRVYSRLAGAFPDFWIALIAIYLFFYQLRIAPPPLGRLGIAVEPPPRITGFYTIDSVLAGQPETFVNAVSHLALPVAVLGLIVAPMLAKVTATAMSDVLRSEYIRHARASGLGAGVIARYALRNSMAPVLTIMGTLFVYLLGGAVLVEKVFSWGGIGQYAVQAVVNADYAAIQGFVLVTAAFTMLAYLIVDLLHMSVDPRITEY
jgi:peptide/nickel transport system permease protein